MQITDYFQDDIESTEKFEVDDNNEKNMMVPENNAIECKWQIVENENIVGNNLEGIEIVVDLQPKGQLISKGFFFVFSILPETNKKFLPQYAREKIKGFQFVFWKN